MKAVKYSLTILITRMIINLREMKMVTKLIHMNVISCAARSEERRVGKECSGRTALRRWRENSPPAVASPIRSPWSWPSARAFFLRAEDGIRDLYVTGVQTFALPILNRGINNESGQIFSDDIDYSDDNKFTGNEDGYKINSYERYFMCSKIGRAHV